MNDLFPAIWDDITRDPFYRHRLDNDGQRFLAWYLRNVHLRTASQVHADITDGKDDKCIDAVFIDDDKRHIVVIQSKFYAEARIDHQPLHELLAAWLQLRDLAALQENANPRLKVKIDEIATAIEDGYELVLELVTTGTLTQAASKELSVYQDQFGELESPGVTLELIDRPVLSARWREAISRELPVIQHSIQLENGKYLSFAIGDIKTVLAAIPLAECVKLPGIRDGTLFRRNVRQYLSLTNKVNKGLKQTITGETPQYFFFYHNGLTALCDTLTLNAESNELRLSGLSIVNGCQSLNTILACSEKAKENQNAYVLFRFYEIPQRDLADRISVYTNSQSAVKARDLRTNDKRVLSLKRAYEQMYPDGFLITKRGEESPAGKSPERCTDIVTIAKAVMTWQCQRPIIAYNENRLFDKHFDHLFKSQLPAPDVLALAQWMHLVEEFWDRDDPGLDEAILAGQSYAKHHLLFAVQQRFCVASGQTDKVPFPSATAAAIPDGDTVLDLAAAGLNAAFEAAQEEAAGRGKPFSVANWLKNMDSVLKTKSMVRMCAAPTFKTAPGAALKAALTVPPEHFGLRWMAE